MLNRSIEKSFTVNEANKIRKRIEKNEIDALQEYFTSQKDEISNTVIVKVNLCRAVIEHVDNFKKFTNNLLNPNIEHYILDFSETMFLDSTFLGSIIFLLKRINANGGVLSLVINLEKITILFQINSLSKILKIYPSLAEATAII
jgi:anti-sigma B factor antagonist